MWFIQSENVIYVQGEADEVLQDDSVDAEAQGI